LENRRKQLLEITTKLQAGGVLVASEKRIQVYAKELQRESKFLAFFVYQLFVSLSLELHQRDRAYTGGEKVNLKEILSQFLEWEEFRAEIASPSFWVTNAEWVLIRLDAVRDGRDIGEVLRLENVIPAVFVPTSSDYTKSPEKFVEESILTACAFQAVDVFLRRVQVENFTQGLLEKLLGFEKKIKRATQKFGGLQEEILIKLWEKTKLTGGAKIKSNCTELLEREISSDKAVYSRALKRLEKRGLVCRESLHQESSKMKRTVYIKLTSLGNAVAKQLKG
jgi:DNA-binding MarR family transcriptional regulator